MSILNQINENLSAVPGILNQYEELLSDVEKHLSIKNKLLIDANKENASWFFFYDQKRIELHTLLNSFESKVKYEYGRLFKLYTEQYAHDLSDRAKDKYIDNTPSYLKIYEIYLEVKELHDKFNSVVESFKSRGYALNNVTKLVVAEAQDYIM